MITSGVQTVKGLVAEPCFDVTVLPLSNLVSSLPDAIVEPCFDVMVLHFIFAAKFIVVVSPFCIQSIVLRACRPHLIGLHS